MIIVFGNFLNLDTAVTCTHGNFSQAIFAV